MKMKKKLLQMARFYFSLVLLASLIWLAGANQFAEAQNSNAANSTKSESKQAAVGGGVKRVAGRVVARGDEDRAIRSLEHSGRIVQACRERCDTDVRRINARRQVNYRRRRKRLRRGGDDDCEPQCAMHARISLNLRRNKGQVEHTPSEVSRHHQNLRPGRRFHRAFAGEVEDFENFRPQS